MKQILVLFIAIWILSPLPTKIYAHVLDANDAIGVVLHIDPDDDPIIGEPTTFNIEIKDTKNTFSASGCACSFAIYENEKQIYTQPLFDTVSVTPNKPTHITYTFLHKGIYEIKITGAPLINDTFSPFSLSFITRVSQVPHTSKDTDFYKYILILGSFSIIYIVYRFSYNKKKLTK